MATFKTQTGVRMYDDMLMKIKFIAMVNHRSFNAQIEYLAQKCIDEYEKKNGEIKLNK